MKIFMKDRNYHVNIGDVVIYNGQTEHAFNDITLDLMKAHLVVGNSYVIQGIMKRGVKDVRFYIVGDKRIESYWYPSSSFNLGGLMDFMKQKYNLK